MPKNVTTEQWMLAALIVAQAAQFGLILWKGGEFKGMILERLSHIVERLDIQNGRVGRLERRQGEFGERLARHEGAENGS